MNLQRAVNIIKRQCGFRQEGDATIIEIIQDAQEQIETTYPVEPLPWFLLTERASVTSPANEERLLLPSDFICEHEEDALWLQLPSGGEKLLCKYDADDLRQVTSSMTSAEITSAIASFKFSYALTGDYFRIFPTPDTSYSYKMIYYQKQTVMTLVTDENRWLKYAPWVLIGMAGENYAHAIRDATAMQYFQQKKGSALQSITDHTLARQLANRRMAMGETL
jgi:hypothetical protein